MKSLRKFEFAFLLLFVLTACHKTSVPRPRGYFRIDFPEKKYIRFTGQDGIPYVPCSFEYPVYGKITPGDGGSGEQGWFNIEFPRYKAKIYLTYKDLHNDFAGVMEQTYRMNVKNHIGKADAIKEQAFNNNESKVYGILYDLTGNTATAVQFYATDSIKHYLRGSLYFSAVTNSDSLAPVIKFFREDIIHLMETLYWK